MVWYGRRDSREERGERDQGASELCDLQWTPWAGAGQSMVIWDVVRERTLILDEAEMSVGWESEGGQNWHGILQSHWEQREQQEFQKQEFTLGQGFRKNSHTTGVT